jgi:hypothetical protein
MPLGLNRTDLNVSGVDYLHGSPVILPHNFGNIVNWVIRPSHFGNVVLLVLNVGNVVSWTPTAAHFGNVSPPVNPPLPPPSNAFGFELEDGSGVILLESTDILLLENQT